MKTLIGVPCMDMVQTRFANSLMNLRKSENTYYATLTSSLIYDSRNNITATAINKGYDRVLWLDSDMEFQPDLLEKLTADMNSENLEYVSALYFKRKIPTSPVVYEKLEYGRTEEGILRAKGHTYYDYPREQLFECAGSGFGAVLVSVKLMQDVWDHYGPPFDPMTQLGEDLSFCWRVGQLGRKMWCDSRIKAGHVGPFVFTEDIYLNQNQKDESEDADNQNP